MYSQAACRWWSGRLASWRPILSFALASVAVLIWTVIGTVTLAGGGTAIIAPLAVLRTWSAVDVMSIAIRACSDLAFPLAVLVLWPEARRIDEHFVVRESGGKSLNPLRIHERHGIDPEFLRYHCSLWGK